MTIKLTQKEHQLKQRSLLLKFVLSQLLERSMPRGSEVPQEVSWFYLSFYQPCPRVRNEILSKNMANYNIQLTLDLFPLRFFNSVSEESGEGVSQTSSVFSLTFLAAADVDLGFDRFPDPEKAWASFMSPPLFLASGTLCF